MPFFFANWPENEKTLLNLVITTNLSLMLFIISG